MLMIAAAVIVVHAVLVCWVDRWQIRDLTKRRLDAWRRGDATKYRQPSC